MLIDLGLYEKALVEVIELLPVYEDVLGLEHPEVLVVRHLHAQVLECLDRYEEALKEVEALRPIRERVLGSEHPNVLVMRGLYAQVLDNMGRHKEALAEVEALRPMQERVQGVEHPDTLWTQRLYAQILFNLGYMSMSKATGVLEDTLQKQKKKLPKDHPDIQYTQDTIEELRKTTSV